MRTGVVAQVAEHLLVLFKHSWYRSLPFILASTPVGEKILIYHLFLLTAAEYL
jgi:hypothetical protein